MALGLGLGATPASADSVGEDLERGITGNVKLDGEPLGGVRMIVEGGGYTADLIPKPTKAPIPLEANNGLKNDTYTIAMARTGNPNSATSQFFINVKDNAMLNAPSPDGHGYAVFGKVVEGTAVVDKIKAVATGNKGPHQNVPTTPVTINSATLVK